MDSQDRMDQDREHKRAKVKIWFRQWRIFWDSRNHPLAARQTTLSLDLGG
jgi:hypothetical protein